MGQMNAIPIRKQFELMIMEVYGLPDGIQASRVLVPSILRDFRKVLKAAEPGKEVSEEYKTEDYLTTIFITGEMVRTGKGLTPCVRSLRVGNKEAVLTGTIAGRPGELL